jgi:negative regulator of sigma E activity
MKEKLSAFMDGELDHSESVRLIRQLSKDKELRGHWQRYHSYGSVLRNEMTPVLSEDFSDRVLQALAKEPVQLSPAVNPAANKGRRRLLGPVAGFAVAASLVGIAVLLQKPAIQETQESQVPSVAEVSVPALPLPESVGSSANSKLIVANRKNVNVRERINQLLVEHNEYNPASDMTGLLPYSRFVGFNPKTDNH